MRPLRYTINVTLDGCVDHRAGEPNIDVHRHATATLSRADALIFGRVTYQMMEEAWGPGANVDAMPAWMLPFREVIDPAKKYVVSSTLPSVGWNAELITGDLGEAVRRLKAEPGESLYVGGVTLPLALAELGLIDEYEFMVQPSIAGHGPRLFDGLPAQLDLRLVNRQEFDSGAVALTYRPRG
ncbi:dihydrofolate reductase family protein [Amycolatopsis rhabdoformis]|uniref:Dihydrofolate reductase family protein n=1 Tax=Amycolatopsis rhabdoformis TaxID=1448059 RepID=A0ABZ1HX57_9PSEU|nr:dihydrofolate reductase family protein [Amycolatopsis rhabdoformis]WSE26540.1 dihydrofolate reductase family protein [Amycolatopsis rhabdoformis]